MLKFLRQYQKWILGVGGSILMVLFLLPSTATQVGGGNMLSETVASMDGRRITLAELREAGDEVQMLSSIAPELMLLLGFDANRVDPERWIMLRHEAERAGLIGHVRDGRSFLPEAAQITFPVRRNLAIRQFGQQAASFYDSQREAMIPQIQQELEQSRAQLLLSRSEESVDSALAKVRGVTRLVEASDVTRLVSSREALLAGQQALDIATLGVVVIPASSVLTDIAEPTEERITEHFEKYRTVRASEDPTGIGYLRDKAVRFEYLKIDRKAISEALTLDPIEVNKYWRQNQARFPGEFAANRAAVEAAYRDQQTEALMSRVDEIVRRVLYTSTAGLPVEGNYRTLPADWAQKMPALSAIAEQVDAELRTQIPPSRDQPYALAVIDDFWRTQQDIQTVAGLNRAVVSLGQDRQVAFSSYVMAARELGGPEAAGVQEGLVYGPAKDGTAASYYFRIRGTRPEGPPDSILESRLAVIADIKLLDAMERMRTEAEVYRQRAVADGLQTLAQVYGTSVRWGYEATRDIVRTGPQGVEDPRVNTPEFAKLVIDAAQRLDPTVEPTSIDADLRTVAMVTPAARGLVVGQITRWRPMTVEKFRDSGPLVFASAVQKNEVRLAEAYSTERLARRLNFKAAGRSSNEEEQATSAPSTAPPAAPAADAPASGSADPAAPAPAQPGK